MTKYVFMAFLSVAALCAVRLSALGAEGVAAASFTTSVAEQELPVKTNITIASSKLNGIVIPPGGTFSFNETVGEGSAANGFLNGRVLYQDRAAYEAGGGICQVSSTLYNALLLSGCSVVERHRHAYPVTYVPLGLDATIRYGKKDLKMKNPHPYPLTLYVSMDGSSLHITVKYSSALQSSYEMYTEEESINVPFDENSGRKIRPGVAIYVYRKKIINGKIKETALLYRDFYPPVYMQ